MSLQRLALASVLAGGLALGFAPAARANNPWEDLNTYQNRTQTAARNYHTDVNRAQQSYQTEAYRAYEDYQRVIQREYNSRRPNYQNTQRAGYDYSRDIQEARNNYYNRLQKAQREYYEAMERARRQYYQNQGSYYRSAYDWEHRGSSGSGSLWDRITGRQTHYNDWNNRYRYDSPTYGYDYGNYYWDQPWRPYMEQDRYARSMDNRNVTYWQDNRGGWGYYTPHEDRRYQNWGWNLSVGMSSPGAYSYVNHDPYTYAYNPNNSYNYYRDYRWNDYRLQYNNRPSFQLAAGTSYYGDSYFYGNLHYPF